MINKLYLALLIIVLYVPNVFAIGVDTGSITSESQSDNDTVDYSITVSASNSDRILVTCIRRHETGDTAPNTVSFNSVSMTQATSLETIDFSNAGLYIYYLLNPPTGTNTLLVEFDTSSSVDINVGSYVIYDAKQQAPEASEITESSSDTITTITDGAMIIYCSGNETNDGDMGTPTNFTERFEEWDDPIYARHISMGDYVKPTAGAETPTVTNGEEISLVAFEAASAGGGGKRRTSHIIQ